MAKRWLVTCKVNMDMGAEAKIIVKANSERKAKIKAENECYSKGYFYAEVLDCKVITERSDT